LFDKCDFFGVKVYPLLKKKKKKTHEDKTSRQRILKHWGIRITYTNLHMETLCLSAVELSWHWRIKRIGKELWQGLAL
jgi:hypothetical protein